MDTRTRPLFNAGEALHFAWEKTRRHLGPLLFLGVVSAFLALLNGSSSDRGGGATLLGVVVQLIQLAVTMAFLRVALRISDGQPVEVPRARELWPDYPSFLFTNLLLTLGVVVGLVLLVVPGVLFGLTFGFAPWAALDRKLDPIEALKESARLTRGARPELFAMSVVLLLLNACGALALGVGLLLTVPMTFIVVAGVYRRLQARAGVASQHAPEPPPVAGPPAAVPH